MNIKREKLIFIIGFVLCSLLTGRLFAAYELQKPAWCVVDCGLNDSIGTGDYADGLDYGDQKGYRVDCSIGPLGRVNWQPASPTGRIVESGFYHIESIPDTTPPTGTISINNGAQYTNSTSVTLTLSASDSGSGVSRMRFSNDGTSWSGEENYATSKAWALISGDGTKTVYVQYKDNAGNWSGSISDTIILDTTLPTGTISINNGAQYTNSTSVTLNLSASDSSGVSKMRFSNDGTSWSGEENYATSKAWALISGDGTRTVYVQYKDNAGNWSGSISDTIILDTTAPTGTISINNGAQYTNSTSVTLTLSASDSGSGVSKMRFSNDGTSWSGEENYATSKAWALISGDGTRTVYVQYKDNAGNWSGSISDTIILDTTALTGTISINNGAQYTNSTSVTLTLSASDSGSGVSKMRFSNDGTSWSGEENYATTKSWTLTSGGGTKMVYVQYKDNAGNWSGSISDTIILDTTAPTISNLTVNPAVAKAGTNLTITFTVSETLQGNPAVAVGGNAATWNSQVGNNYTYTYTVQGIEGEGNKAVNVSAIDLAGNTGSASTTAKFDFTGPICSADKSGVWHREDIIITLTASDNVSGIAIARYNWDTPASDIVGTQYSNGGTITLATETGTDGKKLYLYVKDNAGNTQTWNGTYYLDKTGPICSADNSGVWHTEDITIRLSFSASTGYITIAKYNWDTPASETVGITYSDGQTISLNTETNGRILYLYVKDSIGREKTWSGKYYLDKTDPGCSADKSGVWHRQDVIITLTAVDNVSGISIARYNWDTPASATAGIGYSDGNTITLNTETNGRILYLYVEDSSGRKKDWSGTYYLDKTAPSNCSISINNGAGQTSSTSVILNLQAGDGGSGVSKMEFRNDGSSWSGEENYAQTRSWTIPDGDGEKRVYVRFNDNAGNWSDPVSDTIILDTVRPMVELVVDVDKSKMLPDGEIVGVFPDAGMEAKFSKVMSTESVNGLKLIVVRDNLNDEPITYEEVSLNFEWDSSTKTVRLTPPPQSGGLNGNYLYRLQVTESAIDLAGNTVTGERELTFRTIMDHTKENIVAKVIGGEVTNLKVHLKANALAEEGYLIINMEPLRNPYDVNLNPEGIKVANQKSIADGWYPIEGCLWEIKVCNKNGEWMEDKFGAEVSITFPYSENDGSVGYDPIPLREETLLAFWLNEEHSNWVRVPGSTVDRDNNVVVTGEVPSFSVYALMASAFYDLSDAHAYPVPWKPNDGKDETGTEEGGITFTNLSSQGVIKIYTISGELVTEYEYKLADKGKWTWDVKTSNKEKVFSGVYIYYIENEKKEHKTGKLIIIR